jgi:hypothetical protein
MDYKNRIYFIAPSQNFHPLGLFQDKHSKEFQPNFMANFNNVLNIFHIEIFSMGITS